MTIQLTIRDTTTLAAKKEINVKVDNLTCEEGEMSLAVGIPEAVKKFILEKVTGKEG